MHFVDLQQGAASTNEVVGELMTDLHLPFLILPRQSWAWYDNETPQIVVRGCVKEDFRTGSVQLHQTQIDANTSGQILDHALPLFYGAITVSSR